MSEKLERLGEELAAALGKKPTSGTHVRYGTVVANDGTTLDIQLASGTLQKVAMTIACSGVKVGDRVVLTIDGRTATVSGILATSTNNRYPTSQELDDTNERIDHIEATSVTVDQLEAVNAEIKNIEADYLKTSDADIKFATIEELDATNATVADLDAKKADIETLEADYVAVKDLDADVAKIAFADMDTATVKALQAKKAIVTNAMIADAAIDDAKVLELSGNKITTGELDASKVTVTNLNAKNITTGTLKVGGVEINVDAGTANVSGEAIESGAITADKLSQEVQDEIDGAIETWSVDAVPTAQNEPEVNWTTDAEKKKHVGDVAYVVNSASEQSGYMYRYGFDTTSKSYVWTLIKDTDVSTAIQKANEVEGNLTKFEQESAAYQEKTDSSISSLMNTTTELETDLGTKVDVDEFNSYKQTADASISTLTKFKETTEGELTTISQDISDLEQTATSITARVDSVEKVAEGGISKVEVQYAQNQSTTTAPTDGWSTTAPTWKDGYYVWQKTVTTYKDGTTTESDPTCISGAKGATGATGATGAAGADGVGYKANLLLWSDYKNFDKLNYTGLWTVAKFDDGTYEVTDTGSTANRWSEIWHQSVQSVTDWDFKTRPKVTISIELKSSNLQSLLSRYSLSVGVLGTTSGGTTTREVDGGNPTLEKANHDSIANDTWVRFWYTKDVSSFVLDTTKYTKHIFCMLLKRISLKTTTDVPIYARRPMLVEGDQPAEWSYAASELVGNGVSSITPQYYLSTSATSCTGGSWSTTMPPWTSGTYIWTRSYIEWSDGTTSTTDPVIDNSINGLGESIAATSASLELLSNSIKSLVVDGSGTSLMEQTSEGWRFSTADIMNSIEKNASNITSVNGTVSDLSGNVTALATNVNALLPALDYMSYSGGVLELGKTDSPFKVQITNERIAFVQNGAVIAYLSNNQLYISAAIITDELQIGNNNSHYIWKYRANGHLGLRYYSS